jgi:hypothetical protein
MIASLFLILEIILMLRSKRPSVNLGKKGLILCEGDTEKNYFTGFTTQVGLKRKLSAVGVEIYQPKDYSPVGLVEEAKLKIKKAKKEKSPYDFVWVIFDKDGHQNIAKAFSDAKDITSPKIEIAFSITCFEFFILLHFVKTTKSFNKCDDVISELKKHMPEYEKSNNLFHELQHLHDTACINGDWCIRMCKPDIEAGIPVYNLSAYTNVQELIAMLKTL